MFWSSKNRKYLASNFSLVKEKIKRRQLYKNFKDKALWMKKNEESSIREEYYDDWKSEANFKESGSNKLDNKDEKDDYISFIFSWNYYIIKFFLSLNFDQTS